MSKKVNNILKGVAITGAALGGADIVSGSNVVFAEELEQPTSTEVQEELTSESVSASESESESEIEVLGSQNITEDTDLFASLKVSNADTANAAPLKASLLKSNAKFATAEKTSKFQGQIDEYKDDSSKVIYEFGEDRLFVRDINTGDGIVFYLKDDGNVDAKNIEANRVTENSDGTISLDLDDYYLSENGIWSNTTFVDRNKHGNKVFINGHYVIKDENDNWREVFVKKHGSKRWNTIDYKKKSETSHVLFNYDHQLVKIGNDYYYLDGSKFDIKGNFCIIETNPWGKGLLPTDFNVNINKGKTYIQVGGITTSTVNYTDSTSTSARVSENGSTSISDSNSVAKSESASTSIVNSTSRSTSTSDSNSESTSIADSTSGSTSISNSAVASESTSASTSGSESTANSTSEANASESASTSESTSLSDSISASGSESASASVSTSESASVADSQSTSTSVAGSQSTSTSVAGSQSTSTSTSGSMSTSLSGSTSTSVSTSDSVSVSTSATTSTSVAGAVATPTVTIGTAAATTAPTATTVTAAATQTPVAGTTTGGNVATNGATTINDNQVPLAVNPNDAGDTDTTATDKTETVKDEKTPLAVKEKVKEKDDNISMWPWWILAIVAAVTGKTAYDKKHKKNLFAEKDGNKDKKDK